MYWHWQNLNEDRRGKVKGSGFWYGRAWLTLDHEPWGKKMRLEWQFGKFMFRLKLSFNPMENEIMLSFAVPGVSLYFSIGGFRFLRKMENERDIGIAIHSWALWWSLWENTMEWNRSDPGWMRGTFHFDDFLFGKLKSQREDQETKAVSIPMPEGVYPAIAKLVKITHKRSRWFKKEWYYVSLDIPGGIPHQGKGENSWDCGEDGLFGISSNGTSYEDAIGAAVSSVLTSRRKYGHSTYPGKTVVK